MFTGKKKPILMVGLGTSLPGYLDYRVHRNIQCGDKLVTVWVNIAHL